MIETVGQLLTDIIQSEIPRLDAEPVKHPGTIGDMYEGLTSHILKTAVPIPSLHVVTGFAEDSDGARSPQLDCMVVVGNGREIPYTDARVYNVDDVIAVVEVKKSLYSRDLREGYNTLQAVSRLKPGGTHVTLELVDRLFEQLTRRSPSDDPRTMPPPWNVIYRALMKEAELPARILIGYHGYSTVTAFRKAVGDDLEGRGPGPGTGPNSMPTLIMNHRFPIVKSDGLPYASPIDTLGTWPLMASSRTVPPVRVLLEVLWSRIGLRVREPAGLYGDDMKLEPWEKLFEYRLDIERNGWRVTDWRDANADGPPRALVDWEPIKLTKDEAIVAKWLCRNHEVDSAVGILDMPNEAFVAARDGLQAKGLIGPDPSRPSVHRLLTLELKIVIAPTGEIFAGEDNSGRLQRWLKRQRVASRKG